MNAALALNNDNNNENIPDDDNNNIPSNCICRVCRKLNDCGNSITRSCKQLVQKIYNCFYFMFSTFVSFVHNIFTFVRNGKELWDRTSLKTKTKKIN